jgi:hypothetical protein
MRRIDVTMNPRTKIGTFVYNGVTFIYDGRKICGKNAPIIVCPVCKRKRRVSRSTEAQVKSGNTTGKCHSCGGKRTKIPTCNIRTDTLLTGSVIYWNDRKTNDVSYVMVECGICHEKRYVKLNGYKPKHFTGYCQSCSGKLKDINGSNHPNWKGGRIVDKEGYVSLYLKTLSDGDLEIARPMMDSSGYVREHRLVVARDIGRPLLSNEVVHHINGIKDDNRLENLSLKSRSGHSKTHADMIVELEHLKDILRQHGIPF